MPKYECPFRLGDTVIPIRPPESEMSDPPVWVSDMEEYLGQEYTVIYIDTLDDDDGYIVRLDTDEEWNWRDSWVILAHADYTLF